MFMVLKAWPAWASPNIAHSSFYYQPGALPYSDIVDAGVRAQLHYCGMKKVILTFVCCTNLCCVLDFFLHELCGIILLFRGQLSVEKNTSTFEFKDFSHQYERLAIPAVRVRRLMRKVS